MTAKTLLRIAGTCVGGFAGVFLSGVLVPIVAIFFPHDSAEQPEWCATLVGAVIASLAACLLLIPTHGASIRKQVLCVVLSPALAVLGICIYLLIISTIEIAHPWECLGLLVLWTLVIPLCSFLGYHLPLFAFVGNRHIEPASNIDRVSAR